MVNITVYNYLKHYKSKYSIQDLKAEILRKGYTEVDFNEALSKVNAEEQQRKDLGPVKKLPTFYSVKEKKTKKSVLIAIIVFILLFDIGLFLLLNYFGFDFFGFNVFG